MISQLPQAQFVVISSKQYGNYLESIQEWIVVSSIYTL